MLIKVVPVFAKMYDGMGIELPAATATIMGMSDFLGGTGGKILLLTLIRLFFRVQVFNNEKRKNKISVAQTSFKITSIWRHDTKINVS